jgi:hypothetical protein
MDFSNTSKATKAFRNGDIRDASGKIHAVGKSA